MSEPMNPEGGGARSAPRVQPAVVVQGLQRRRLANRIALGIAIALLAIALPVGVLIWGTDSSRLQFRIPSSILIASLSCVSIEDVKYDAKEFSDPKLADTVVDALGIKTVLFNADYEACPWGLVLAVAPGPEPTAQRDGSAVYLVSSRICARRTDGTMKPDDCISRNLHIVTQRPVPHELFMMGVLALKLRQIGVSP